MARVLFLLVLAVLLLSFIVGIARPETGAVEKVVLFALCVGCVVAAAKVASIAEATEGRLGRH